MNHLPTPYHITYVAHLAIVEREVAKAREKDRRECRKRLNEVLWLNVIYLVSIRVFIDTWFKQPWMKPYQSWYPASILVLLAIFWFIWFCGKYYIFQPKD
jgi:hypothetical protein